MFCEKWLILIINIARRIVKFFPKIFDPPFQDKISD